MTEVPAQPGEPLSLLNTVDLLFQKNNGPQAYKSCEAIRTN